MSVEVGHGDGPQLAPCASIGCEGTLRMRQSAPNYDPASLAPPPAERLCDGCLSVIDGGLVEVEP